MSRFANFFSYFLWPLSALWEQAYRWRRFAYNYGVFKKNEYELPIISIGNLSFGGTGKTPCTLWLAEFLLKNQRKPMVIMRGYKGKLEKEGKAVVASEGNVDATEVGDEAALLSNRLLEVPVVVGKRRSENLSFYFPKFKPDVVLLDDGHQHLKLERDINIVLFDALMSEKKYKTAPLGYLREGLTALQDADAILFSRADQVSSKKISNLKELCSQYISKSTIFAEFRYIPRGFYSSRFEKVFDLEQLQGKKIYVLSGIASPESFYNLLESLGMTITQKFTFPDHHKYIAEDLSPLLDAAKNSDSYIITTEKDMIKLREFVDSERLLYLEIQLDFLNGQREFENLIKANI